MDIFTQLARDTIKLYLTKHELPKNPNLSNKRAGCFVSLHTKDGKLRGCIGTIEPYYKSLAGEIVANAVAAATGDPRFESVKIEELDDLDISVDVLNPPELIASEKDLDIKKYGVIVRSADGRDGLLLPDIEGVDDVAQQIAIARQKAGIDKDEQISLFRFTVERHK